MSNSIKRLFTFLFLICSSNYLNAQSKQYDFELKDNFKLVYESVELAQNQKEIYHFIGNYVYRETHNKNVSELFGGPPAQIIDLNRRTIYNLFPPEYIAKEAIIDDKKPTEFSEVLSVSDTIIDGFEIAYVKIIRGEFPKYQGETHRYYLSNYDLPPFFTDLSTIYRGKNTLFNSIKENLLYKIISRNEKGVIYFEMQLSEVSHSKYTAKDIEKMLNIN